MDLCKDCAALRVERLFRRETVMLKRSFQSLTSSAGGRRLCSLFYNCLHKVSDTSSLSGAVELFGLGNRSGSKQGLEAIRVSCSYTSGHVGIFAESEKCKKIPLDVSEAVTKLVWARHIKPASDFECALRWMNECQQSHPECGKNQQPFHPTRLVQILSPRLASNVAILRLVSGSECTGKYATLSHCWGQKQIIRTTKSSLETHLTGINWNSLSKTFQDAVHIARALNIAYIWIDSLCIIQDDFLDWEIESTSMISVYRHAFLNIAASASSDGSSGCYIPRPPGDAYIQIPVSNLADLPTDKVYVGPKLEAGFNVDIHGGSLCRRGWVVQERLLSTRRLYYAQNQLYWQCQTAQTSESRTEEADIVLDWRRNEIIQMDKDRPTNLALDEYWESITIEYSGCALTNLADKLPALSGIARAFAKISGYRYIVGLWQESLWYSLLWVTEPGQEPSRSLSYRAPSWSWVSVDGGVSLPFYIPRPGDFQLISMLRDIEVDIEIAGNYNFGRITSATLTCTGRLKVVEYDKKVDKPSYWELRNPGAGVQVSATLDVHQAPQSVIYGLEVLRKPDFGSARMLLLEKTGKRKEYRRIGTGHLRSELWFRDGQEDTIHVV